MAEVVIVDMSAEEIEFFNRYARRVILKLLAQIKELGHRNLQPLLQLALRAVVLNLERFACPSTVGDALCFLPGNLRQDLIHFMGNNKNESTPCFLDWELRVKMAIELVDKKTKVFNFKKLIGSDEFSSRQVDEQLLSDFVGKAGGVLALAVECNPDHLAPLMQLSKLQYLDMLNTHLSDNELDAIAQNLPELSILKCSFSQEASVVGLQALRVLKKLTEFEFGVADHYLMGHVLAILPWLRVAGARADVLTTHLPENRGSGCGSHIIPNWGDPLPLEQLVVYQPNFSASQAQMLPHVKALKLSHTGCQIENLRSFPNLESLQLGRAFMDKMMVLLDTYGSSLKTLILYQMFAEIDIWAILGMCPHLENLTIEDSELIQPAAMLDNNLIARSSLKSIKIGANYFVEGYRWKLPVGIIQQLMSAPSLKCFKLANLELVPADCQAVSLMAKSGVFKELEEFCVEMVYPVPSQELKDEIVELGLYVLAYSPKLWKEKCQITVSNNLQYFRDAVDLIN